MKIRRFCLFFCYPNHFQFLVSTAAVIYILFFVCIFLYLGEGNLIFCCTGSRENYFWSVGRQNIIIILSFRVDTSKNKNIDHEAKDTCAIKSTQNRYQINHISLL